MTIQNISNKLALAICLACGMGSAQAAINYGSQATLSSGELFMQAYDVETTTVFDIDLGTTVESFLSTAGTDHSWSLGDLFNQFTALSSGSIKFNVGGANLYKPYSATSLSNGVLVSELHDYQDERHLTNQLLKNQLKLVSDKALRINVALSAPDEGGYSQTDYAANLSIMTIPHSQPSTDNTTGAAWVANLGINQWNGSATLRDEATDNDSLDFIWWHQSDGVASHMSVLEKQAGVLTLDLANATLNWTATVPVAVPLPGAAWLFMGGLLSMLRLQVRSRALKTAV